MNKLADNFQRRRLYSYAEAIIQDILEIRVDKIGTDALEFQESDAWMRKMFADECVKNRVKVDM